jgi:hypothetical protein
MDISFEHLFTLGLGIALAASCGFRVFLPLLVVGICNRADYLPVPEHFSWIASNPALILLGSATIAETLAYFIPWVDNLLDTIATPAAAIAGGIMAYGILDGFPPWMHWSLALICGTGTAGAIQTGTVTVRAGSTATTGGIANPLFAAGETAAAGTMVAASIFAPALAIVAAAVLLVFCIIMAGRFFKWKFAQSE